MGLVHFCCYRFLGPMQAQKKHSIKKKCLSCECKQKNKQISSAVQSAKIQEKSDSNKQKINSSNQSCFTQEDRVNLVRLLFPDIAFLEVDKLSIASSSLHLFLHSTQNASCCPQCHVYSEKKQSLYCRQIQGFPLGIYTCRIHLQAHRFYCQNPRCARKIFCERFPSQIQSYQRCLDQVNEQILSVGLQAGASKGVRILNRFHIEIKRNSIIRRILALGIPRHDLVKNIGLDDWAKCKGHRYGTIIIDNDTHKPLDLLLFRDAHFVSKALEEYTAVKTISSDRADCFSKAIRKACPGVKEIADRWHLSHNLREVGSQVFRRYLKEIRDKLSMCKVPREPVPPVLPVIKTSSREQKFCRIKELQNQGYTKAEISRQSGISLNTIRKYWTQRVCPVSQRKKYSGIQAYDAYLKKRFYEDHIHSSVTLLKELKQMGYSGCHETVNLYIRSWRSPDESPCHLPHWKALYSLLKKEDQACSPQEQLWRKVMNECKPLSELLSAQAVFDKALKTRDVPLLNQWLRQETSIEELKQFIRGLRQDYTAVVNAFKEKWHNGITEGFVNKLKMIKRMSYGRAGIDLLKRMLVYT